MNYIPYIYVDVITYLFLKSLEPIDAYKRR